MGSINLDELYHEHFDGLYYNDLTDKIIKNFAIDFGKKLLEMAVESAEIKVSNYLCGEFGSFKQYEVNYGDEIFEIDKQSILNVIKQIN